MNPTWHWSELYAGGLHVATYAAGATYFDHSDWLGTVRARSDVTGASTQTCSNLPFGDAQNCTGTDRATLHFTGKELDTESNLTHFLFRQLSTTQGRWLMPDPAGMAAANPADPQSWNRYTYVGNNPISGVDPLGLVDCVDGHYGCNCPSDGCSNDFFGPRNPGNGCDPSDASCGGSFGVGIGIGIGGSNGGGGTPGGRPGAPSPSAGGNHGPWANGETLGLPKGLNLKPMGLSELIGLSPGTQCDFGVCGTIGSSFSAGPIAIAVGETIGKGVLTAADALGILLGVLLMQTGDVSPCAKNPEAIGCGKWQCTASCNVQGIGNVNPTIDRVLGTGFGSSEVEACTNAKRAATQYAPNGTYARHCRCSCTKR
jgi:RHS repeat-associated protein